ncbi:MAG: hypothetical protein R3F20_12230 [Planctomycetota bacterium]
MRTSTQLVATSNENYLTAFRRDPLFSSFKARLELVRVPYLMQFTREKEIYDRQLAKLPTRIRVAPHLTEVAAVWAVMTRLMEPLSDLGHAALRRVVEKLTPLDKARLYDDGTPPAGLGDEERSLLRAHVKTMREEYDDFETEFEGTWDAAYEGRRGCSPRELATLLSEIAVSPPGECLTPLLFLRSLGLLTRDAAFHEFLRLARTRNRYHDVDHLAEEASRHYFDLLQEDVRAAAELAEETEYGRLLVEYVQHLKALRGSEKVRDAKSGQDVDPDRRLMERVEERLGVTKDAEAFRVGLMTKLAAFKLEHPDRALDYDEIFPDLVGRLRRSFFEQELDRIRRLVGDVLVVEGVRPGSPDEERRQAAREFARRLDEQRGYCRYSRIEALEFFLERIGREG